MSRLKFYFITLLLALSFTTTKALDISIGVYQFQSPEQAYAEVSMYVLGSTVTAEVYEGGVQASVQVLLMIKKGDQIVRGDKFNLVSPLGEKVQNFFDVKRYALDDGEYTFEFQITDNADPENKIEATHKCILEHDLEDIYLSDIQLFSSVKKSEVAGTCVKNGVFMEQLPFNYYHKELNELIFYAELYNTDKSLTSDYFITYRLNDDSAEQKEFIVAHKRLSPGAITPILQKLDISEIPSGNYYLTIEAYDRDKNLLGARKGRFIRSNPAADIAYMAQLSKEPLVNFAENLKPDEVRYALKAIAPIVPQNNNDILNYLIKKGELKNQKFFVQRFWSEYAPQNPKAAFDKYMEVARAVDNMYMSGLGYGFETDRGHTFLKYGRPDDIISIEDEPSAPPYEIWFYYDFPHTRQTDVKFLFYNPSLSTNDYTLLHSTAIGEYHNSRWEIELYRDAPGEINGANSFDATTMQDNFNRRAREYFLDN